MGRDEDSRCPTRYVDLPYGRCAPWFGGRMRTASALLFSREDFCVVAPLDWACLTVGLACDLPRGKSGSVEGEPRLLGVPARRCLSRRPLVYKGCRGQALRSKNLPCLRAWAHNRIACSKKPSSGGTMTIDRACEFSRSGKNTTERNNASSSRRGR